MSSSASEFSNVVTNCDLGPGCGMLELVEVVAVLFVAVVALGVIIRARRDDN